MVPEATLSCICPISGNVKKIFGNANYDCFTSATVKFSLPCRANFFPDADCDFSDNLNL